MLTMKKALSIPVLLICLSVNAAAFNKNNLDYVIGGDNGKIYISKTYKPNLVISWFDDEQPGFNNPEDIFIDSRQELYVADTGNNRIVRLSLKGELIRIYAVPEDPFQSPKGVFVDGEGDIYVADTGNSRIVVLNADGEVKRIYLKPESRFLDKLFKYEPTKVGVGVNGYIYTIIGS